MSDMPAALKHFAEHPFLKGLTDKHLEMLADCAMSLHFNPGDLILREGDPANRFYLINRGKVSIEADAGEKHIVLQTVGAGDVLGWSWLFPPYYLHFDARAVEPTEVMFFYGTRLRELCDEDHDLGYEMLTRIAKVVIGRLIASERKLCSKQRVSETSSIR